jgi:integrase
LENNRLAIIGKARGKRPAFRHLPILPIVNRKFKEMFAQAGMEVSSGAFLFGLSSENSNKRTRLTTAELDHILADAASRVGWTSAPIYYGLRHRFRTDMLKLEVDESTINFLMGHESVGQEPYSIYTEKSLRSIEQEYRIAASELADWYSFTDGKEI